MLKPLFLSPLIPTQLRELLPFGPGAALGCARGGAKPHRAEQALPLVRRGRKVPVLSTLDASLVLAQEIFCTLTPVQTPLQPDCWDT